MNIRETLLSRNTVRLRNIARLKFKEITGKDFDSILNNNPIEINNEIDKVVSLIKTKRKYKNEDSKLKRSQKAYLSVLRSIAKEAIGLPLPNSNIIHILNSERLRESNKYLLTFEQVQKILEYLEASNETLKNEKSLRNFILIKLLAGTGQRIGDILDLEVENSLYELIKITQNKTKIVVHVENPCKELIQEYVDLLKLKNNQKLFNINYITANRLVKDLGKTVLGKSDITPHCFRKYTTRRLADLGYSSNQIRSVTGHSTSGMIDYYTGQLKPLEGISGKLV